MLGAPDCTQSPNIGGNLANIGGMDSVMDCMQSPNIGANLGIITAIHSVVDYTQLPNISGNLRQHAVHSRCGGSGLI